MFYPKKKDNYLNHSIKNHEKTKGEEGVIRRL